MCACVCSSHITNQPVLKYVEADPPIGIDIWMEHLRKKLDYWGLVWVFFAELHRKLECAILKGGV